MSKKEKTEMKSERALVQQQENIQQKYFEMQTLMSQIKEQQKQMQLLENQLIELATSKKSLDDFEKIKEGNKIKVLLCPGIFAEAELKNNKELFVNIGASVIVKKTVFKSKKLLEKQFIELQRLQRQLIENIQKMNSQAQKIEREISFLSK